MSKTKSFLFVFIFVLVGAGCCFAIFNWFVPTTKGDEFEPINDVEYITNVYMVSNDYYVNQPINLQMARLGLKLKDGRNMNVALTEEYVVNFDSTKVGNFVLKIQYYTFSYEVNYSVGYKSMVFGQSDYCFDFELNENVDMNEYKINCLDYYDKVVETKSFNEIELSNFSIDTITFVDNLKTRTATIKYENLIKSFDYSVFYFSGKANYVGTSELIEDGYIYEIDKFLPSFDGTITIQKRIASNNLIQSRKTFDVKRVDTNSYSMFLSGKALAKISYETKQLTLLKNAFGNSKEILIDLTKTADVENNEPYIKGIVEIKNVSQNYIINQETKFEDAAIVLKLSDDTLFEVSIDENFISNFSVEEVGTYTMKISYCGFDYSLSYKVSFKSLSFYTGANENYSFTFNVGDDISMFSYYIICYDFYDNPVEIKDWNDSDVFLENFNPSVSTELNEFCIGVIKCYGAQLEFKYVVL